MTTSTSPSNVQYNRPTSWSLHLGSPPTPETTKVATASLPQIGTPLLHNPMHPTHLPPIILPPRSKPWSVFTHFAVLTPEDLHLENDVVFAAFLRNEAVQTTSNTPSSYCPPAPPAPIPSPEAYRGRDSSPIELPAPRATYPHWSAIPDRLSTSPTAFEFEGMEGGAVSPCSLRSGELRGRTTSRDEPSVGLRPTSDPRDLRADGVVRERYYAGADGYFVHPLGVPLRLAERAKSEADVNRESEAVSKDEEEEGWRLTTGELQRIARREREERIERERIERREMRRGRREGGVWG